MNHALTFILVAVLAGAIGFTVVAQDEPAEKVGDGPAAKGPRGPDRFFNRHDANEDGKVTLDELLAPAKKMMEDLDADDDGAITKEEFAAARKDRPAREGKGEGEGDGMRRRGPRGEGQGEGEGQGPRGRRGGGEGRERPSPEDIFKKLDTDGDGNVSLEEFKAGRPQRGPRGGGRR